MDLLSAFQPAVQCGRKPYLVLEIFTAQSHSSVLTITAQELFRPLKLVSLVLSGEDKELGWKLKEERILEAKFEQPLLVFSAALESQAKILVSRLLRMIRVPVRLRVTKTYRKRERSRKALIPNRSCAGVSKAT